MDLEEVAPIPEDSAPARPSEDAPYGYKKDGTPAKRRGRKPGSTYTRSSSPRRTSASLETQIGAFLWTVNVPLQLVPVLQRDALDAVEIDALAKAINQECERNARFRKFVEQALAVQGGTNLVLVLGLIIGRRAIRHGIVPMPEEMGGAAGGDAMLGGIISMTTGKGAINPNLFAMANQTAESDA
jgi:hypothetical protein